MTNILLKLFAYINFILLPFYAISALPQSFVNLTLQTGFTPKNIDEVLKCNECCIYYKDTTVCDVFYNLCMTETLKDGVFMFTKDRILESDSKVINRIKQYKDKTKEQNIIFVFINKRIFFFDIKYIIFRKEIDANIKKLENKYKQLSSDDSFKKNQADIYTKLKIVKIKRRPIDNLKFLVSNYTNIDVIVNKYVSILGQDKEKIITLYNKDLKESCINKLNPTSAIALKTTLPANSLVTENSLLIDDYKKLERNSINSTIIGVTVAITAVAVVIVAISSFFIYKKHKRHKPETEIKLKTNNKNAIAKSVEHIYEEPGLHYNVVDLFMDDKKNNRSSKILLQRKDNVYIPCIYDSDFEVSNDTLIKINNLDSNSNLHEQQDIAIKAENDGNN